MSPHQNLACYVFHGTIKCEQVTQTYNQYRLAFFHNTNRSMEVKENYNYYSVTIVTSIIFIIDY